MKYYFRAYQAGLMATVVSLVRTRKVKLDRLNSMAQITDRKILPDIERQITTANCDNKRAFNG